MGEFVNPQLDHGIATKVAAANISLLKGQSTLK